MQATTICDILLTQVIGIDEALNTDGRICRIDHASQVHRGQSEVMLSHMTRSMSTKTYQILLQIYLKMMYNTISFPSQSYFHFKRPMFLKGSFSLVLPIKQNYFLHQNYHELLIILNLQNKGGDIWNEETVCSKMKMIYISVHYLLKYTEADRILFWIVNFNSNNLKEWKLEDLFL